jgi:hypothetical protein
VTPFGRTFTRCPKAWIRDDAAPEVTLLADVLRYHSRSTLPYAGGWADQPARFTDAEAIVTQELSVIARARAANAR